MKQINDYFSFDVLPHTHLAVFENDEPILRDGQEPHFLYYLIEGRAKVLLFHKNGKTSLVNFIDAPGFLGEMELLGAQKTANEVRALTPCTCYVIDTRACREQLLNDTKFLRCLCLFLSRKTVSNTENFTKNLAYPLENRLAKFILMTACGKLYRERHTEVAEYLGVSYRHLLYVLADLTKRGVLEKTPRGYYLRDMETLQKLADME